MLLLSQSQFWQEQGIYEHQAQGDGAYPVKDGCTMLATCVGCMQLTEEVHLSRELNPIHKTSKDNRAKKDRTEIEQHGACAQETAQYQYGSKVARRTSHKENQCGTWCETLHHQSHGNRDATRGTQIHGHGNEKHKEHAGQSVVLEESEIFRGDNRGDDACNNQTYNKPLANVLDHINIGILQGILQF